jgi:hypothetical protein
MRDLVMASELRIVYEDPEYTLGVYENAFVWSFRGEVTVDRIRRSRPVHRDLVLKYPSGFGAMTIIGDKVPLMMPPDSREAANAITAEFKKHYRALAIVIEGTGFRAAAARAVTSGINLFARVACPTQVFDDARKAALWLTRAAADPASGLMLTGLSAAAERVRSGPPATGAIAR